MPDFIRKTFRFCILSGVSLSWPYAAVAAEPADYADDAITVQGDTESPGHRAKTAVGAWQPVDGGLLDVMRGGFGNDHGLKISFGIERMVSMNGALISTTRFSIPDVGRFIHRPDHMSELAPGTLELVQNGAGNAVQFASLTSSGAATFIQNTLNDQTIKSLTVIDATTNSLEIMKGLTMQSVLKDAVANSVSPR